MATARKAQPQFTKTAKAAAQTIDVEATPVVEKPLLTRIDEWLDQHLAIPGVASWQRVAVGYVLGLAAAAGVGYLVGHIASILVLGTLLTTGSMFVPLLITALALVFSYWAGGKVANFVYSGVVLRKWNFEVPNVVFMPQGA